jgi:hypothetical protein
VPSPNSCQRTYRGRSDLARFAKNGSPLGPEIPTISLERLQNFGPFRPDDDQLNTAVSRAGIGPAATQPFKCIRRSQPITNPNPKITPQVTMILSLSQRRNVRRFLDAGI